MSDAEAQVETSTAKLKVCAHPKREVYSKEAQALDSTVQICTLITLLVTAVAARVLEACAVCFP